jgi:hypothetical protein
MGLASTIVDGPGIETESLDSCSPAFKADQTVAAVGELVIGLVTTGGAATALVVAKMVAKQGLKNTLAHSVAGGPSKRPRKRLGRKPPTWPPAP